MSLVESGYAHKFSQQERQDLEIVERGSNIGIDSRQGTAKPLRCIRASSGNSENGIGKVLPVNFKQSKQFYDRRLVGKRAQVIIVEPVVESFYKQ